MTSNLDESLQSEVLRELRELRRATAGVTVESLATSRVITRLLGDGDPYLAYTRLQHALLDATSGRSTKAAAASLGFSSAGATHLDRLVEAGDDLGGLDQRQVRRLSDKGLEALSVLIASNWAVESVPSLDVAINYLDQGSAVMLRTVRPLVVAMGDVEVDVLVGNRHIDPPLNWVREVRDDAEHARLQGTMLVSDSGLETSLAVVWRGELWPKFAVHWLDQATGVSAETLGNKLMIRLRRPPDIS